MISKQLRIALANLAIENMFPTEEFLNKLIAVDNGELTFEDLRKEILQKYGKNQAERDQV